MATILFGGHVASAQPDVPGPRPSQRTSFNFTFGVASPQGRQGLREFWLNGPGGGAEFVIHLNPVLAVGAGAEMAVMYFDQTAFQQRWPNVPLQPRDLFAGNVYLHGTWLPFPQRQTRPFIKLQAGAGFFSEAHYAQRVNQVNTVYYDVGGRPRLSVGVAAGAIVLVSANVGILFEVKGTFVHNDPAISFLAHGRAGVQLRL